MIVHVLLVNLHKRERLCTMIVYVLLVNSHKRKKGREIAEFKLKLKKKKNLYLIKGRVTEP